MKKLSKEKMVTTFPVNTQKTTELKDYFLKFRITDRQMKPQHLAFTKTKERVNWVEEVSVDKADSEVDAVLGGTMILASSWSPTKYDIECIEVKEKLIQVPKLILPPGVRS